MGIRASLSRRLSTLLRVLDGHLDQEPGDAAPDAEHRVVGVSYPPELVPDERDPRLAEDAPTLREALAGVLAGGALTLLRPQRGDVVVVRTATPLLPGATAHLARTLWPRGVLVVQAPLETRVHLEPQAKPKEDLGYRETRNVEVDAGAAGEQGKHVCGAAEGDGRRRAS